MAERSKAERTDSIEQRLEAIQASLSTVNTPAHRPSKPIALTLRLDPARYARLNAHAARYTPRRSFQAILIEALDAYLDE
jgi:hypothetical protein